MADGDFEEILPQENYVNLPESKLDDDILEVKESDNVSVIDYSVNGSKSDSEDSLGFNSSTNHSLFISSSNVSESGIECVDDELNNVNDKACDLNIIGRNESNDCTVIGQIKNCAPENVDDDCYVMASFKSTTPVKNRNSKGNQGEPDVSLVECVDLTQDEPKESKFEGSFVNEFTKDTRLCILLDVIPDADPDFLIRKVHEFKTDDDLQLFVLSALEMQDYPKKGAGKHNLLKQAGKSVTEPDYIPTSHKPHLKFTNFDSSNKAKNKEGPPIFKSSYTVPSISAAHTSATQDVSYINSLFTVQKNVQPKLAVVGAKPHTVTSQEAAYDLTSSNIPRTVTSQDAIRHPKISVEGFNISQGIESVTSHEAAYDLTSSNIPQTVTSQGAIRHPENTVTGIRISPQGIGKLRPPYLNYIPTSSTVSSVQTENNDDSINAVVNVPAHPFTSLQTIAPNIHTRHATYIDAALPLNTHARRATYIDAVLPPITRARHASYIDAALLPRPKNIFPNAHDWLPLGINIFNPTQTNDRRIEQIIYYNQEYRRRRRYEHGNIFPYYLENRKKNLVGSLNDSTIVEKENPNFNLLSDIFIWADREFLRIEAKKLRNDDDVQKFLIRVIANEELWNKCVIAEKSAQRILSEPTTDKKYKILLELLPDANRRFLKQESAKLKNGAEIHEFAMKLGREKTYPKCRSLSSSSENSSIKRKHSEISEMEAIDPKYQTLLEMLPDADPDFLLQESKVLANPDELQEFVLKAVENNTYPKRDKFLERQDYHKQWKKYIENFNVREFLQVIPNPVKYFYIDKVNSKNPLDMPEDFLQHRYRRKCNHHFACFFKVAKHNLTKTCDILDVHFQTKVRKYGAWDQKTIFSTSILQEIAFIQNKKEIAHYLLFKEEMKLEAYEKGKREGTLQECSCCYDDKLLEDMTSCCAGHVYCLNCIKRGSEVVIGNGGTKFPCYFEGCKEEFSFDVLNTVLNPEVFSRLLIRKQYEEVNAAGIPGLETCSFCEFCSIPPAEDKLFHCLNPSCMKVTCRSCRKLDHLPLSCEEFTEKQTKKKMQSYVEDKMTEALVRTCWQCGTKFVKSDGCNMMQCKCGAKMCYFCRQPIEDYHHFNEANCGKFLDTTEYDEAAVIKEGKKAKQEIEAANPGLSLSHDPTQLHLKKQNHNKFHKSYF